MVELFSKLVSDFQLLFSQKTFIIDFSQGSTYTSDCDQRSNGPEVFALSFARKIPSAD